MMSIRSFLTRGGPVAWALTMLTVVAFAFVAVEGSHLVHARSVRERALAAADADSVATAAMRRALIALNDSVRAAQQRGLPAVEKPIIIVSLADNRLWVREQGEEIFTTRIASGSGRTLTGAGSSKTYRFDTPRGKLTVQSKETAPAWVPPDWHFVEKAGKKGLGLLRMKRGQTIPVSGGVITTRGSDVIKRFADGSVEVLTATDGRELVAAGRIIIPPFGTNARRYKEILGTHRLNLGDGYALHGTNAPSSIGRSVSHGCVRLRNEDIETLYRMIPVGTAVYIY
jgi:lipoprotein-anchoring transpeptidase ErfK/SrfK